MTTTLNLEENEAKEFGPWIYEISDKHPIPRLFQPYFSLDDKAIFKFKIPCNDIEHRDITPGMDLYDYVIALYTDYIRILKRNDGLVREQIITANEFIGILLYHNLLQGVCTILTTVGEVTFPFNTVSDDIIQKMTKLLLENFCSNSNSMGSYNSDVFSLPTTEQHLESDLLRALVHMMRKKQRSFKIGAIQKDMELTRINNSAESYAKRIFWEEVNPESAHMYTDRELIVLQKSSFPVIVGSPDYGYSCLILPFEHIEDIKVTESTEFADLRNLTICAGKSELNYYYKVGNAEIAEFYDAIKNLKK